MKRENVPFKVYLGKNKFCNSIYLSGFSWDCGWYWGGGYLGNKDLHTHFDSCFLNIPDYRGHSLGSFYSSRSNVPDRLVNSKDVKIFSNGAAVWEDLSFFFEDPQFSPDEWWRIKDLYKQFYIYREAAEAFQYGGHCTNKGRTEKEINKEMAEKINDHIQEVIIPQIVVTLRAKVR